VAEIKAKQAADYLIRFSQEVGDPVTNLKLQKLLYYAQGWYLALHGGKPLFDDRIEAWPHGPVVPPVYGAYKEWGWNPISGQIAEPALAPNIKSFLNEVMEVYGIHNAYYLERLTHREKPWLIARGDTPEGEPSNAVISIKDMWEYFTMASKESEDQKSQAYSG
jgi:uncharacterized phage-associated protein